MIGPRDRAARSLARGFGGDLLWPGEPGYDEARVVENRAFDERRPALIARARDARDVAMVIAVARDAGSALAPRSGGHSVAGHSTGDGVVVLDLGALDALTIDPIGRTATAGAGVRAGPFTAAADALGFAVPFGDNGHVGVAGLTVGGGIGWVVRKFGLTIDSLLDAEVVLASGSVVHASVAEEPDLFWAIRGGGGNFGVVTRLMFRLNEIGRVLHGTVILPYGRRQVTELVALGLAADDALTLMPSVMPIPPVDPIPSPWHGRLGFLIDVAWAGPPAMGWAVMDRIRGLGEVLYDDIAEKDYHTIYRPDTGVRTAWTARCLYLDRLDDQVLATIERSMAAAPPGETLAHFRILGGAAGRPPRDATAYGWRDKTLLLWIIGEAGAAADGFADLSAWAAAFQADLRSAGKGMYANFMADEGPAAAAAAYPPATWRRLREIKRRYDPDNLFRANVNIPPALRRPPRACAPMATTGRRLRSPTTG